jgi:dihydrolipoamide dehydrogenase
LPIDEKQIVSSTGALDIPKLPKKLVVVGAGYIGLEMGTVWSRLGAEVEVVDFLPRILPGMDAEIASKFKSILEKQGIKFHLGKGVKEATKTKTSVSLTLLDSKTEEESKLTCNIALVAVGRKPHTDGLGLETMGVELTQKGQVKVDHNFQTNIAGIYAIGDVIEGPMLAHKAEEDGVAAVEIMAGHAGHVDYALVPGIVYTAPEIATIGQTEEQLKEAGIS